MQSINCGKRIFHQSIRLLIPTKSFKLQKFIPSRWVCKKSLTLMANHTRLDWFFAYCSDASHKNCITLLLPFMTHFVSALNTHKRLSIGWLVDWLLLRNIIPAALSAIYKQLLKAAVWIHYIKKVYSCWWMVIGTIGILKWPQEYIDKWMFRVHIMA